MPRATIAKLSAANVDAVATYVHYLATDPQRYAAVTASATTTIDKSKCKAANRGIGRVYPTNAKISMT